MSDIITVRSAAILSRRIKSSGKKERHDCWHVYDSGRHFQGGAVDEESVS